MSDLVLYVLPFYLRLQINFNEILLDPHIYWKLDEHRPAIVTGGVGSCGVVGVDEGGLGAPTEFTSEQVKVIAI